MAAQSPSRIYFQQQREALIGEIAMNFEQVLANINKLNRNLEAVIAVGNEFSSVEALWSQFENVMGKDGEQDDGQQQQQEERGQEQEQEREQGKEQEHNVAEDEDEQGGHTQGADPAA